MKNKFKKQKRKLFAGIAIALFMLSVSVCLCFSIMIYQNEQNSLYRKTEGAFNNYLGSTINNIPKKDALNYFLNLEYDDNIYMTILDETTGEVFAERKNAQSFWYSDYDKNIHHIGVIDYEHFRASMSDEQYNKISKYLLAEDKNYMLVCTEYFYYDTEVTPKVVEVAEVKKIAEDSYDKIATIESFELHPEYNPSAVNYKIEDFGDNYIEKEFFLGEYNRENLIEQTKGLESYNIDDYRGAFYYTGWFEFIYTEVDTFYFENFEEPKLLTATFAQKFNVLESCKDEIIMIVLYILFLFVITGVILGYVMWRNLKKQIEQENRLRTVTNAMAHQLKTPLFVIGGYAENLAENVNTDKRTHYAQVITEQTNAMNEMVCKMLDYSRLDSENFTLKVERFELTSTVKEILENYQLDNSQLEYENEVYIEADKRLIKSVVENLIDNAVKYSTDTSKISIRINNNTLLVKNPYKSVTNQELQDMWKPYYRSTEKEKAEGHGLGLAIVKNILDLHKFKYNASYSEGNIIFKVDFK